MCRAIHGRMKIKVNRIRKECEKMAAKHGNLSINSDNIFPIIKKWLYSDHDIFFRELISNGCDAITKLKKLDMMGEYEIPEDNEFKIRVIADSNEKTLTFIDNGIGMTADEVEEYINQIIQSPSLKESVSVCDNELLNTILCRYIRICDDKKIGLRADIRRGLLTYIPYDDLTALFCNLLDNAVEATIKVPDSYIDLSVTYNETAALTMLTMINSCYKNPFSEKTGKLVTSKQNHLRHGYGLKSIQRIVTKYHGNMQTYFDNKNMAFHTIVTLKAPEGQ